MNADKGQSLSDQDKNNLSHLLYDLHSPRKQ